MTTDTTGANLYNANLQSAFLYNATLQGANLHNVNLRRAYLGLVNLQGADLYSANFQGAFLYNATLQGADLYSANFQGAFLYNATLQGANLYKANFQGACSRGASLQGAYLERANLQGVDLQDANLKGIWGVPVFQKNTDWSALLRETGKQLSRWAAPGFQEGIITAAQKRSESFDRQAERTLSESIQKNANWEGFLAARKKLACQNQELARRLLDAPYGLNEVQEEQYNKEMKAFLQQNCPHFLRQGD